MSYGLIGAHRVGKTTLAERLSNETNYGLLFGQAGDVFKRRGVDPAEPMDFGLRLEIQNELLDVHTAMWSAEKGKPFFTDRTPICMLGYTTADLAGHLCLTDREYHGYMQYRERCFDATNRFFGAVFVVQPGIPIADPGDKPTAALNRSYIEHLNSLMIGLANAEECLTPVYVIDRDCLGLEARCREVIASIVREYAYVDEETRGETIH